MGTKDTFETTGSDFRNADRPLSVEVGENDGAVLITIRNEEIGESLMCALEPEQATQMIEGIRVAIQHAKS